jgi:hypothetical protein
LLAAVIVVAGLCGEGAAAAPSLHEWRFTVRLDGDPIGSHRFVLSNAANGRQSLSSEARIDVAWLGLPLYRYRHRSDERWDDGCLKSIEARTDDNGRVTELRGEADGSRFALDVSGADGPPSGGAAGPCLMSFAYWHPDLARQQRLLDPASGRIESVTVRPVADAPADPAWRSVPLRGLRITGLPQPIVVWYADDRWIGLDTVIDGGRRLTYRLH